MKTKIMFTFLMFMSESRVRKGGELGVASSKCLLVSMPSSERLLPLKVTKPREFWARFPARQEYLD
jgi:hypothetical protein